MKEKNNNSLRCDQPDTVEAGEGASRTIKDVTRASDMISRVGLLFKKGTLHRESIDANEVIEEMIAVPTEAQAHE
jgi:hypothetical protein